MSTPLSPAALVRVPFDGDELAIVRDDTGAWLVLPTACAYLGVRDHGQVQRLQRTPWAEGWVQKMCTHDALGRAQPTWCLHLDIVPMWLATLQPRAVRPELREKLVRYKCGVTRALRGAVYGGSQGAPREVFPPQHQLTPLAPPSRRFPDGEPRGIHVPFEGEEVLVLIDAVGVYVPIEPLGRQVGVTFKTGQRVALELGDEMYRKILWRAQPGKLSEPTATVGLAWLESWLRNLRHVLPAFRARRQRWEQLLPRFLQDYLGRLPTVPVGFFGPAALRPLPPALPPPRGELDDPPGRPRRRRLPGSLAGGIRPANVVPLERAHRRRPHRG